jgi:oligoendopeptidase F
MELQTYPRTYLPADFDPGNAAAMAAVFNELEERPIADRAALEKWLLDWQEVTGAAMERYARAYLAMTGDTTSEAAKSDYLGLLESLLPLLSNADFKLQRKLLASAALDELDPDYYGTFLRNVRAEVEIFREENVPLLMEDERMGQEYTELVGAERVEFRGQSYTPEQIAPFLEETDRDTREEAWRSRAQTRLASGPGIDEIFTRMIELRQRIAANAGEPDYRAYVWKAKKRFNYSPDDSLAFHDAIARHVVPLVRRDAERRKRLLGLDTLRPWDMEVDPDNRPAAEAVQQRRRADRRVAAGVPSP